MPIEAFMKKLVDKLGEGLYKLFELDKLEFNRIIIYSTVLEDIINFAKHNYPKEFVAFFHGQIKDKKLVIDSLQYHEFDSDENSASPIFRFADKSFFGSVHSHPGHSNRPSRADRQFFNKTGILHAIICMPYIPQNIAYYNMNGELINVEIMQVN
jgi:proteasome lid subunit RPN8/RPN11